MHGVCRRLIRTDGRMVLEIVHTPLASAAVFVHVDVGGEVGLGLGLCDPLEEGVEEEALAGGNCSRYVSVDFGAPVVEY